MQYDTFFSKDSIGALKTKQDIKVLICYILSEFSENFSKSELISILQKGGFANYFDISNALMDLTNNNNIKASDIDKNLYTITDSGKIIAEQLQEHLPFTIKEKVKQLTNLYLNRKKIEKENSANIIKKDNGYDVVCSISGGDFNLMSLSLYVPDIEQAMTVKENFYKSPGDLYRTILSLLVHNK